MAQDTNQLVVLDIPSGTHTPLFRDGTGGLSTPFDVAVDRNGGLLVTSSATNEVLRYDRATGAFLGSFVEPGHLLVPRGIVIGPDGNLYVASYGTNEVVRFDATTGAFVDVFATLSTPDDFLWLLDDSTDNDGDGVVGSFDNCDETYNPAQVDIDEDGAGDLCDNCPLIPNPGQHDIDSDDEGDFCDSDDGLILFTSIEPYLVFWQYEARYESFNVYRGDTQILRAASLYTQDPANEAADAFCDLTASCGADACTFDPYAPTTGAIVHYLVEGVAGGVLHGLGADSAGSTRPNDWPCP